ncbi:TPA: hypothetical protein ACGW1T_003347 [Raoultella ornithinolytica]|uniref:Uncharacterized protein n=1 Tax=Pluralibacter gergoviae TaxID=61647 RepID=A0AAI9GR12_PLUGE|nr:hypothetical protein [Pluralibacter gergoviae]EKV9910688.1 hypothetical protein [Pluralibacter gergoviae]EKW7275897.1 hypothetical protein [Pluralibacter gergoviae]ELD4298078.1 hypothetical protein [Pluralibacter gergoviae]ELD4308823.1 hypothetical protein [Pluralibacter gergoviae]
MDLLEASAQLERIELLAKISHFDEMTIKEKTVALGWIGEIAEELGKEIRKSLQSPQSGGISRGGCGFQ